MQKTIFAASVAALTFISAPAFAQDSAGPFSGARAGVLVGTGGNNFIDFDGQTIGIDAGYDFDLNGAVVGIGAEYQTDIGDDFLDVNESALLVRVGGKAVEQNVLVYVSGGYSRVSSGGTPFGDDSEHGYRVGLGVEVALNARSTLKIEQRYYDYGAGDDANQTVAGLSFRF